MQAAISMPTTIQVGEGVYLGLDGVFVKFHQGEWQGFAALAAVFRLVLPAVVLFLLTLIKFKKPYILHSLYSFRYTSPRFLPSTMRFQP